MRTDRAPPERSTDSSRVGPQTGSVYLSSRIEPLWRAIKEDDDAKIEEAILRLSHSRRVFAPLALAIGAFAMLLNALRLLVANWRLTLVQILPAMWICVAMLDLKAHVLHGRSLHVVTGPVLIPVALVTVAITVASFFLNAVFAFAIARPGAPTVRPAVAKARRHLTQPRRDKLWSTVICGALGAAVCTPPYLLGRLGILMLGSSVFLIPGTFELALGVTLQAGATGAVSAIKMSVKLIRPSSRTTAAPQL